MSDSESTNPAAGKRERLVGQLLGDAIGALELLSVYVGDRLGPYRALATGSGMTSAGLAAAAGVHERYAREWLEHRTVNGILETDNPDPAGEERSYRLPPGHEEPLVDESSLNFMAPLAQRVIGGAKPLDAIIDAFRTGAGVPYEAYGDDTHESQARGTRPRFKRLLTARWLPAIRAIHRGSKRTRRRGSPMWRAVVATRQTRAGPWLSQGPRRWHRPRRGLDPRRARAAGGQRRGGSSRVSPPGRRRPRAHRQV